MIVAPMKLRPCYKEYLWGGTKLKSEFGKRDGPPVIAESWELACHPDGNSMIAQGEYRGKALREIIVAAPTAMLGSACDAGRFPILVKLIDAAKDLSIQVHPSDQTAIAEDGERGKAEMWYIVDCEPQSSIYYGFSERISEAELMERVHSGTICEVLNRVPVSKGSVFYVLPGMIHAIGAGIVVAEIQQNSNTTFRVYDYDRRDAAGNPRMLHLERASKVLDYEPILPEDCRVNSSASFPEYTMKLMFSCRYFKAYCLNVRTQARLCCDGTSFQHLLCVEGSGTICFGGEAYLLSKGESYFLPAVMGEYEISGECCVLLSRV